jgi:hypothetical protein
VVFDVRGVSIKNLAIAVVVSQQMEYRFMEHVRWRNVVRIKDMYIVENARTFLAHF